MRDEGGLMHIQKAIKILSSVKGEDHFDIPLLVTQNGKGYFRDLRPYYNEAPYDVIGKIVRLLSEWEFKLNFSFLYFHIFTVGKSNLKIKQCDFVDNFLFTANANSGKSGLTVKMQIAICCIFYSSTYMLKIPPTLFISLYSDVNVFRVCKKNSLDLQITIFSHFLHATPSVDAEI